MGGEKFSMRGLCVVGGAAEMKLDRRHTQWGCEGVSLSRKQLSHLKWVKQATEQEIESTRVHTSWNGGLG